MRPSNKHGKPLTHSNARHRASQTFVCVCRKPNGLHCTKQPNITTTNKQKIFSRARRAIHTAAYRKNLRVCIKYTWKRQYMQFWRAYSVQCKLGCHSGNNTTRQCPISTPYVNIINCMNTYVCTFFGAFCYVRKKTVSVLRCLINSFPHFSGVFVISNEVNINIT